MPAMSTSAAPAPATKRPRMNSGNVGAYAHTRLPAALTTPPSASAGRRPTRSASLPAGMASRNRARPQIAIARPIADWLTPNDRA